MNRSILQAALFICWILISSFEIPALAVRPLYSREPYLRLRHKENLNDRPLIGILSQGGSPAPKGHSYIAASYVKFIEAAGARVVPILHDMDRDEVIRRFNAVNGILFPGGSQPLEPGHPYFDTASLLYDLTIKANDNEDYFPLHATCLGFEAVAVIASKNTSILEDFDAEDYAQPLYPTDKAEYSRFFSYLPPQVVHNLYSQPYAMQNHAHGLSFQSFKDNPALGDVFNVLTLSIDRQEAVYVSTIEAKNYPITGTQWHPEKNAFEWTPDKNIPHNRDAIEVTQEVANYFIDAARHNHHAPQSRADEEELLIYNWNDGLYYSGKRKYKGEEVDFDEIYVFPDADTFMKRRKNKDSGSNTV